MWITKQKDEVLYWFDDKAYVYNYLTKEGQFIVDKYIKENYGDNKLTVDGYFNGLAFRHNVISNMIKENINNITKCLFFDVNIGDTVLGTYNNGVLAQKIVKDINEGKQQHYTMPEDNVIIGIAEEDIEKGKVAYIDAFSGKITQKKEK